MISWWVRHSSSTSQFHQNHQVVLVVSWLNCQNFSQKFNFKPLCPWKSQNLTYGFQVTNISNKIKCPPSMSRRDKIIFSLWMVQADSNVIKKWRFCWLHPQWENYFVSSWQISNEKKLAPPHHEKIILSGGDIGKNYPHPTMRKLFGLVVTNFNSKKNA